MENFLQLVIGSGWLDTVHLVRAEVTLKLHEVNYFWKISLGLNTLPNYLPKFKILNVPTHSTLLPWDKTILSSLAIFSRTAFTFSLGCFLIASSKIKQSMPHRRSWRPSPHSITSATNFKEETPRFSKPPSPSSCNEQNKELQKVEIMFSFTIFER